MPRVIEVSATPSVLDDALHKIKDIEGVVSIARQQGASLIPPGDVLSIHVATDASHDVLEVLHELDVAESGSILTSDVMSIVSPPHQKTLDRESDEAALDEMAFLLRRDANPSPNYLVSMFLAGAIAASGLWLDMLHLIIGAMVIAPAFEPLVRLPFGLVTGARELIPSGIMSIGAGFALLATGAAAVGVLFEAWGAGPATELGQRQWVSFWSTLSATGIVTSALGGMAGGVVISGRRSVLTTGVMITLALIPSMAVVGLGIVVWDLALVGRGLLRWSMDVALVMAASGVVFALKRTFLHADRNAIS